MKRPVLLLVVNNDWFFLSHRKDVAVAAQKAGYDVTIVTRDNGHFDEIHNLGLKTIELQMNPTGLNPFQELKTLWFLIKLYRKEKPDIVHQVGPKVNLWGTIAARIAGVKAVVNAVSGLGVIFDGKSTVSRIMPMFYRWSHIGKNNLQVIFQNDEDKAIYLSNGIVKKENCRFIMGSGVNLEEYTYAPEPEGDKVRLCFTARMLKEKGVYEIIEAARLLHDEYKDKIEFVLCGGLTEPTRSNYVPAENLRPYGDSKYFQWLGLRDDVLDQLKNSHIFIFPSYYREGLPKSCIEANAVGRPIITTDNVGCRDTVIDGHNGYIIPTEDAAALADRIKKLVNNKELRVRMGLNARQYAEEHFSIQEVISRHLSFYKAGLEAAGWDFEENPLTPINNS